MKTYSVNDSADLRGVGHQEFDGLLQHSFLDSGGNFHEALERRRLCKSPNENDFLQELSAAHIDDKETQAEATLAEILLRKFVHLPGS